IAGARTANGTFAVRDSVINRIDVRFRVRDPQQVAGGLTVRMWQGPERSHLVLETQLDSAKLRDEQAVTLYFEPQRDAPGRSYAWEIAATGEVSRTGIALCSAASGEPAIAVYGSE